MRPMSSTNSATNLEMRAAVENSGTAGSFSIAVRTLRSVSQTGLICSSSFKKSPQLELFLISVLTCR